MKKILLILSIFFLSFNGYTKDFKAPRYRILERTKMINGKFYADVLIKSYSTKTPLSLRKKACEYIAKKEKLDQFCIYSTISAKKANFSQKYRNKHPNALKNGYLGAYENENFTPPL